MKIKEQATLIGNMPISVLMVIYIVYLFLIGADILTTFGVSPDLKYEYNPVINNTQMGWCSIMLVSFLGATFLFFVFSVSLSTLYFGNRYKIISSTGIALFICHFSYSYYTITNNFLSGVYLKNINWPLLKQIANWYINKVVEINYFYETILMIHILFSLVFVYLFMSKINLTQIMNKKYRKKFHDKIILLLNLKQIVS